MKKEILAAIIEMILFIFLPIVFSYDVSAGLDNGKICFVNSNCTSNLCIGNICMSKYPHDYYDTLVELSELWKNYSLRVPGQVESLKDGHSIPPYVTYNPANDSDPRRQDAAKVHIGINGNSLANQAHIPLQAQKSNETHAYFFTWDAWYGRETMPIISNLTNWKTYQFTGLYYPNDTNGGIWFEVQTRFSEANRSLWEVGKVRARGYANKSFVGDNAPQVGNFTIKPETWVRYWVLIEQNADTWDRISLWVADENNNPVKILDRVGWESFGKFAEFWFEFNTSTQAVVVGRPPLIIYIRNFIGLMDFFNPEELLIKPGQPDYRPVASYTSTETCNDEIQNQNEEGVDCGGVCDGEGKTCAVGIGCSYDWDCVSNNCINGVCNDVLSACVLERNLTDYCLCGTYKINSGFCCYDIYRRLVNSLNVCANCTDGIKNQNERAVDCGGYCSTYEGKRCVDGTYCKSGVDCLSNNCIGACSDGTVCGGNGDCSSGECGGMLCMPSGQGGPYAPSNLAAKLSFNQINLTWKDNSNNEEQFIVERKNSTGNWSEVGRVGVNITNWEDRDIVQPSPEIQGNIFEQIFGVLGEIARKITGYIVKQF